MKRWLGMLLCLLFGLSLPAGAEENALFPAKGDHGKWGYIDCHGTFVIPAQFDGALGFRGDYAEVFLCPSGHVPRDQDSVFGDFEGIIDRSGHFVLPPTYSLIGSQGSPIEYFGGKDTGIWIVTRFNDMVWGEDEDGEEILLEGAKEGFFDIQSGYFSGLQWDAVWPWVSFSRLIPVIDETFRSGYVDRTTGELVIPCLYQPVDPTNFYEGVASVALETADGNNLVFFLMDETGREIPLPEGVHAVYGEHASDGRVAIQDESMLFGFADVQGHVVIAPQFIFVNGFEQGYAVVQYPEGDWAVIDREGNALRRGLEAEHWSGPQLSAEAWEDITGVPWEEEEEAPFPEFLAAYDEAAPFENGLALVREGSRRGYVDESGHEIYFWQETDEE